MTATAVRLGHQGLLIFLRASARRLKRRPRILPLHEMVPKGAGLAVAVRDLFVAAFTDTVPPSLADSDRFDAYLAGVRTSGVKTLRLAFHSLLCWRGDRVPQCLEAIT